MITIVIKVLAVAKFKLPSCKGGSAVSAGWKESGLPFSLPQKSVAVSKPLKSKYAQVCR